MRFTGMMTMDLAYPLQLETEGDLVLFSVLPLGHTKGELDLGVPLLRQSGELGGVAEDVIRMAAEFEVNLHADTMNVTADGEIDVFRVRVGEADFLLDLRNGILNTDYLGRPRLLPAVSGESPQWPGSHVPGRTSKPRWRSVDFRCSAATSRPDRASHVSASRSSECGSPSRSLGSNMLNPGRIADLLDELLKINFEDLGKSLAALLSGNVTMNPFSDFGSGGGGMGDSSDDGKGKSGGKAPGDLGEGLGDAAREGKAHGEGELVEEPSAEGGLCRN